MSEIKVIISGYEAVFDQAVDGTWGGYVPALATILTNGRTLAEAGINMKEAIEIWLEEMKAEGFPIPAPVA